MATVHHSTLLSTISSCAITRPRGALVKFGILGPTELIHNGEAVPLGAAKQRGMLAVLLYHAGELVRIDTMTEYLWHQSAPTDRRAALYSLASRLRAVLGRSGLDNALVRVPGSGGYRLDVDPNIVDVHQFRTLLAWARDATQHGDVSASTTALMQALTLWRGEPLLDLRSPRAELLRQRLHDLVLDAHKLLADNWLSSGHHHNVLAHLESVVHDNDLDEALARTWATALCRAGRQDEARRFLVTFRRRFRQEMHTAPDIDLAEVLARAHPDPAVPAPTTTPPPSSPPIPQQLPHGIADFTGHDTMLAELDALTHPDHSHSRVVLITGMPGVGKTTLATHWAQQNRDRFPDGQLYLDAGAYGPDSPVDPVDAIDRFLRALGVPPDQMPLTAEQRRDHFNAILSDRRILVVLDNVRDSTHARALIPRSETSLTLVTSRNRLSGLTIRDGVRTVTVTPLSEPESVALLTHVVGTARAHAEPQPLQTLAHLTGGLPLAVRIVGEHVAERPRASIADLAGELRDHLLDMAPDDDEAACLPTVFAWSYNALRLSAQHLFRHLTVHPGSSISAEAAAAILGSDVIRAESLLNTLAKAHLITHDTARRYRFHDLIRRFAIERAAADDGQETIRAQRRLLDWYLLSAAGAAVVLVPEWPPVPDLPTPHDIHPKKFLTDVDAMTWCETERENLCAVAKWAAHHGFDRHGWQIPGVVYEIFDRYGSQDDILQLNRIAVASAERDGHEEGRIGTLNNLGATYFSMHDFDRAAAIFVSGRDLARVTGRLGEENFCSNNLASTYLRVGNIAQAIAIYEHVLHDCRRLDDAAGEAATLHNLGEAYLQLEQYSQATDRYTRALAIRERIGSLRGRGHTHGGLGALYLATGNLRLALHHCHVAVSIHSRTKDQTAHCDVLLTMTEVHHRLGNAQEAARAAQEALRISDELADPHRRMRVLAVLGTASTPLPPATQAG